MSSEVNFFSIKKIKNEFFYEYFSTWEKNEISFSNLVCNSIDPFKKHSLVVPKSSSSIKNNTWIPHQSLRIKENLRTVMVSSLQGDGRSMWNTQLESKTTGTGSWHSISALIAPQALNKTWCWSWKSSKQFCQKNVHTFILRVFTGIQNVNYF